MEIELGNLRNSYLDEKRVWLRENRRLASELARLQAVPEEASDEDILSSPLRIPNSDDSLPSFLDNPGQDELWYMMFNASNGPELTEGEDGA